jgi:8-oxo-dGTP pyrophosphatase MutT (NUDIX family)
MIPDVASGLTEGKAIAMRNGTWASGFLRHVAACRNADLPGRRTAFRIGAEQVGWVLPSMAAALSRFPAFRTGLAGVGLSDPTALQAAAKRLADEGMFRWRDEEFDVRARPEGPVLARLDRGALPAFGIEAAGVHVNGVVDRPDGTYLWVARRAADKTLDPGKLDHIVAGGVPAGLTPAETLVKEAWEEAAIPADLACRAVPVGIIRYTSDRAEGHRRDLLHCYDLALPQDFRPRPQDGEVESFDLWPLGRVMETVRTADAFKFNVNLVLIDLCLRRGLIGGTEARLVRAGLSETASQSDGGPN